MSHGWERGFWAGKVVGGSLWVCMLWKDDACYERKMMRYICIYVTTVYIEFIFYI